MDKSKAMRNIFLYIAIIMACMFFLGFFTAKKVYASETSFQENMSAVIKAINELPDDIFVQYTRQEVIDSLDIVTSDCIYCIVHLDNYNDELLIQFSDVPYIVTYYFPGFGNDHILQTKNTSKYAMRIELDGRINLTRAGGYYNNFRIAKSKEKLLIDGEYEEMGSVLHTSHSIIYDDSFEDYGIEEGTVFFYPETIITRMTKSVRWEMVMEQVVFLIPISLGLVISFLGLRKALAWLSTMLKRA